MGHHINDQHPPIRLERAMDFSERRGWNGYVRKDETKNGEVQRLAFEWQLLEIAGADIDVRYGLEPACGSLEHFRRRVHGNDATDERCDRPGQPTRPASQVAHHPPVVEKAEEGTIGAVTEELLPQSVPFA